MARLYLTLGAYAQRGLQYLVCVCVCVSVTQHLTLYVQSISVVFERFRSVSDLRLRFRNHIHIVCDRACGAGSNHGVLGNAQLLCQLASPVCLFYHYCSP